MSYLWSITGAKFEQHLSNVSRDILEFVMYLCTETICVVIKFSTRNLNISGTSEDIQNKKTPFLFPLKDLSN